MAGLLLMAAMAGDVHAVARESAVCGALKERFFFWQWSLAAPAPNASRVERLTHVEAIRFVTADDKRLAGYRYLAHDDEGRIKPQGYLLMAMGNAMVADRTIREFADYAAAGYDVYVYDYRGYAHSEGKRRINAIIEDYKEIVAALNEAYPRGLLYGTSLGGAVLMNVIGAGLDFDRAVIDSSPSRFSPFGCPERIDPVNNLPADADDLLVITGGKDTVLGADMTAELREEAANRGATVHDGDDYAHPFMDSDARVRQERRARIAAFLLENDTPE